MKENESVEYESCFYIAVTASVDNYFGCRDPERGLSNTKPVLIFKAVYTVQIMKRQ